MQRCLTYCSNAMGIEGRRLLCEGLCGAAAMGIEGRRLLCEGLCGAAEAQFPKALGV